MGDIHIIVPPEPALVDALGQPLRTEPEFTGTFVNSDHAKLERESMEAALRVLLRPATPPEDPYVIRFGSLLPSYPPAYPFLLSRVADPDDEEENGGTP